jgi:hypothetical protein
MTKLSSQRSNVLRIRIELERNEIESDLVFRDALEPLTVSDSRTGWKNEKCRHLAEAIIELGRISSSLLVTDVAVRGNIPLSNNA